MRQIFIKKGLLLMASLLCINGVFAQQWSFKGSVQLSPGNNWGLDCGIKRELYKAQINHSFTLTWSTEAECEKERKGVELYNREGCGITVKTEKCQCKGCPSPSNNERQDNSSSPDGRYYPNNGNYGNYNNNMSGYPSTTFSPPPQSQSRGFEDSPVSPEETKNPVNALNNRIDAAKIDEDLRAKLETPQPKGLDPNLALEDSLPSSDFDSRNVINALQEAHGNRGDFYSNIDDVPTRLQNWKKECEQTDTETLSDRLSYYQTFEEMALLSLHSYPGKRNEYLDAFEKSGYENIAFWSGEGISGWGFDCTLYKKGDNYVLAFAGTDSNLDRAGSWVQGGITPTLTQSRMALSVMEELKSIEGFPMDKLIVTGHSLGGRLAAEVAIEYGVLAYTFNAAGVSTGTKERLEKEGKWNNTANIINIQAGNDGLTSFQEVVSVVTGSKSPYVNNSFVNSAINALGPIFPSLLTTNKDITTVGGVVKIDESAGGHDMGSLYNDIMNRKEVIYDEIIKR